jgi:UDP-glucuronate decarboxylase
VRKAAGDEVTGPMNMGNPQEIQMRELAERIIQLTGSDSRIEYRPLPQDDPTQRCPDITLARKLLDWQPTVALDEGLQHTIAYFVHCLAERGEVPDAALDAVAAE